MNLKMLWQSVCVLATTGKLAKVKAKKVLSASKRADLEPGLP